MTYFLNEQIQDVFITHFFEKKNDHREILSSFSKLCRLGAAEISINWKQQRRDPNLSCKDFSAFESSNPSKIFWMSVFGHFIRKSSRMCSSRDAKRFRTALRARSAAKRQSWSSLKSITHFISWEIVESAFSPCFASRRLKLNIFKIRRILTFVFSNPTKKTYKRTDNIDLVAQLPVAVSKGNLGIWLLPLFRK